MKRSEAARYARWSVSVAALLAAITLGVYLRREVVKTIEIKNAPAPAPQNVERQSNGLTFSKVEGNRTVFTVNAGKSTEFRDKGASLLEDVRITIFGKTGERHDTIHTQSCQYAKESGTVVCSGDVQLDMQSAADAERVAKTPTGAAPEIVHVETRNVTFNRGTGAAHTPEAVRFTFPGGSGDAIGVDYDSGEGTARLLRDVKFTLRQPVTAGGKAGKENSLPTDDVQVQGTALDFARDARRMHLQGPAEAQTSTARLTAGEFTLELDEGFRAQNLLATAGATGKQPAINTLGPGGSTAINADRLSAQFAPQGWLEKINADGNVQGAKRATAGQDDFSADQAAMDIWPRVSDPKELELTGNVVVKSLVNQGGPARLLQTTALRMEFSGGKQGQQSIPKYAETLGPGTLEWTDGAPPSGNARALSEGKTKLSAGKLQLSFGAQGKASSLVATGNVRTERAADGHPTQIATAQKGTAQLADGGGWSRMDLQGNVRLSEGDRKAQAGRAVFVRADQTATLTEQAAVRDATAETRATRITFSQATGDIRAEGKVRSTDFSSRSGTLQLAPAATNITADVMQANSKTGRALYSGGARLWQGDSVMEAEAIELLRDQRILNAAGNVRAVFPQSPQNSKTGPSGTQAQARKLNLWHLSAATLTYNDKESFAHLEKNVVAQSADQRIRASAMDLYFTRSTTAGSSAVAGSGAQQISKAIGTGGVVVEDGVRKATAERGEYTAADGKFVMSGGNPTLADGTEGTTSGRQLTFFLADDTIIVDSENGSRILTKHRVEK